MSEENKAPSTGERLVPVARIGAAHGLKGEVRLKALTHDPSAVLAYRELDAGDGRRFTIEAGRPAAGTSPDMLVVRLAGIHDRTAAEALNGIDLFVARDRLPEAEADEFYHSDLIGLSASTVAGDDLGTVIAVRNFGAGDLIEIAPRRGETMLIPFTKAVVPEVDLAARRLTVDPPPGLLDGSDDEEEKG